MDRPDLPPEQHRRAMIGLARLNRISRCHASLWRATARLASSSRQPLRVLDLATGSGDVPLRLWAAAKQSGLAIEIAGVDISPFAIDTARKRAAAAKADVQFSLLDVLACPLPRDYDVIIVSLFMHHLSNEEAKGLLSRMAAAARRLVLVNDLVRGRIELAMVWLGARLVSNSSVVHADGSLSVRASFTPRELAEL
jgi:2-polyprenyl-3-methyl-5-hydroxy-6-metoxy-1,4-benzoquinol methylase